MNLQTNFQVFRKTVEEQKKTLTYCFMRTNNSNGGVHFQEGNVNFLFLAFLPYFSMDILLQ